MSWYAFPGGEPEYLAWHAQVCDVEQIPHPGRDQHTDAPALGDTWTDAYAAALQLVDGRLVVYLEADDPHTATLTPTVIDRGDDGIGELEGATELVDRKELPPVWDNQPVTRATNNQG